MQYVPTIGLEIHAELKTATKMFCGCRNDPEEKHPNVNVCPICLAHPGTLPVPNKKAIEAVILVGMALAGETPATSKFDRKNYFYPDLPKGYQISQYDLPLVFGGVLNGVRLTRIHLEEDTGALTHANPNAKVPASAKATAGRQNPKSDYSLVNFNRAGVPLMELVTEPDICDADQAVQFAKELQLILRYLGVSDADMEKGQMRVEANISLRLEESKVLGTKVEVKNINSFKAVHDAIQYEIKRQAELLDAGKKVVQETRGWNEGKQATVSQRTKEEAHDYRYFPEPDIPPLDLSKFNLEEIKQRLPELPQAKRARFAKEYNLKPEQVEILVADREASGFFEETVSELEAENTAAHAVGEPLASLDASRSGRPEASGRDKEIQLTINYLTSDLRGLMTEWGIGFDALKVRPENFADLMELIAHGKLSSRAAKDILAKMFETGGDPHEILKDAGLEQVSDESALLEIVKKLIAANPAAVADYKRGKTNVLQFLVGKAMGELKGKGNPAVLQKIFKEALNT